MTDDSTHDAHEPGDAQEILAETAALRPDSDSDSDSDFTEFIRVRAEKVLSYRSRAEIAEATLRDAGSFLRQTQAKIEEEYGRFPAQWAQGQLLLCHELLALLGEPTTS